MSTILLFNISLYSLVLFVYYFVLDQYQICVKQYLVPYPN